MIIIAFSRRTSKKLPRVFCRHFKHVAPILINNKKLELWQFIKKNKIVIIPLRWRDISILEQYGWVFIYKINIVIFNKTKPTEYSCVQFVKNILGIKSWRIQTPYQLYKYLNKKVA